MLSSCIGFLFLSLCGYWIHDLHLPFVKGGSLGKARWGFLGYWVFVCFLNLYANINVECLNWLSLGVCRVSNDVSFVIVL